MRVKRLDKFRRSRKKKSRRLWFFAIILPCASILLGYVLTATFILPVMAK